MQTPSTAPTPQPFVVDVAPQTQMRPLTQAEMSVIRNQRSEMSEQLQSAQNRRARLINEIRAAPPGTEEGLREQYQVLSDRIVAIETDIEAAGRTLRTGQVPQGTVLVPPRSGLGGQNATDDAERGAALAATILIPIFALFMWRRWRRRRRGESAIPHSAEYDSRFERLEQAVDAIALEIERVGEAQRYQTKLLAEANLMPAFGTAGRAAEPNRMKEFDELRSRTPDR